MSHPFTVRRAARALFAALAVALLTAGCTTLSEYVHNGFKVGPNYRPPPSPVAEDWIDAADSRIVHAPVNDGAWWSVFHDPALDSLIATAYQQNLPLKITATRVLQARAERNVTAGNLLPQSQGAFGAYVHEQLSKNLSFVPGGGQNFGQNLGALGVGQGQTAGFPHILNIWTTGFNASWELDFWGRLRRAVESANAELGASVEARRDALVTLVADVASNYVQVRTFQQRIAFARHNVEIQKGSLRIVEDRLKEGRGTGLDVAQAQSILAQTEATIPPLEIGLRQANNRLCLLLGEPPHDIVKCLNDAPIPSAPPEAAVGIPAELLERRPDIRQARRRVAAQSAQIGVAEADFLPQIRVFGYLGYSASSFNRLFDESSFTGILLPNFQWKILNYGRILNNVRSQNALLAQRVLEYGQTVLTAGREVEDGLIGFLQYQAQIRNLSQSVQAGQRAVELVVEQYRGGRADFNRVFTTEAQLVTQLDQLASARGNSALSLIAVYRALGGGWRVFEGESTPLMCASHSPAAIPEKSKPNDSVEEAPRPRRAADEGAK